MIFEVTEKQIAALSDEQLTELLRKLLIYEADRHAIPLIGIAVSLNITAPDGGLDASIRWKDDPAQTSFLSSRDIGFQCKATAVDPEACANEIVNRTPAASIKADKGKRKKSKATESVKPLVDGLFGRGGDYVLFANRRLNQKAIKLRVKKIRQKLSSLKKPYAKAARIHIYAANAIRTWTNTYLPAIVYVQAVTGFPVVLGLKTWTEWHATFPTRAAFFSDGPISNHIAAIRKELGIPSRVLRLVGLSGLGKTRLALEALAPASATDPINASVVYFDAGHDPSALINEVSEWRRLRLGGVLVVDNCPADLHKRLHHEISSPEARFSLLTLDLNPDERLREVTTLVLRPGEEPHVIGVVKKLVPGIPDDDAKKIAALASGFVYFAILLAGAWRNKQPIEHALPDAQEIMRMLWGANPGAEAAMKAIQACALFDSADLGDGSSDEANFIAHLADLPSRTLLGHLGQFEHRGLIERYGNFIRVRPHPLALKLCADWWRRCMPAQAANLFSTVPESMVDPLCNRLRMLSFLAEAKSLTEKLCGAQGPFGQAEVLSSARGARIFRALVELNPEACISALANVVNQYDIDQLRKLEAPRRDWVWALERLIFRSETYEAAAAILARLAAAEFENYGNNATGILLQTFHVQLSGTEADLERRGKVFSSLLLESDEPAIVAVGLKAVDAALRTEHFSRMVGAEDQGVGPALQEYRVGTIDELVKYWRLAIDSLSQSVASGRVPKEEALETLARHLRGLVRAGQFPLVDEIISRTRAWHTGVWEGGLEAIGDVARFEGKSWKGGEKARLAKWIAALAPKVDDIPSRIAVAINRPSWSDFFEESDGEQTSPAETGAKTIAEECAQNFPLWRPHLKSLFIGEQRMGFAFGYRLGELLTQPELFIETGLAALEDSQDAGNPVVLLAFLRAIAKTRQELVDSTVGTLLSKPKLQRYAVHMLSGLQPSLSTLLQMVSLAKSGAIQTASLRMFSYGQALSHLSPDDAIAFAAAVYALDSESAWTALELLYMYTFGEGKVHWPKVSGAVRGFHLSGKLGIAEHDNHHDIHLWKETVLKLLAERDPTLATAIANQLVAAAEGGARSYEFPIEVATTLLAKYGPLVWPIFAEELLKKESRATWSLKQYIGRGMRGSSYEPGGPIEALDETVLKKWLTDNPSSAPAVASMIRPLKPTDESYEWTPLARLLIDRYGQNKDVLRSLSANIYTGSWSGSRIPFYEGVKRLAIELQKHPRSGVRAWAGALSRDMDRNLQQEKREADARQIGRW